MYLNLALSLIIYVSLGKLLNFLSFTSSSKNEDNNGTYFKELFKDYLK